MFFLTGFPGFLGSEMMLRLLSKDPAAHFLCLVQEKFLDLAKAKRDEMIKRIPNAFARVGFIIGDITIPGLGVDLADTRVKALTEVFHFAAVYDLNITESLAKKVNVQGTKNVLDFAQSLTKLKKFHYVSTCYVSGSFDGTFKETDFDVGQKFNNFYESTKFEAEYLVREKIKSGMPVIIYRPSIVVGNSKTGETQKFDGPYFIIQWFLRQKKFALLPKMGNSEKYLINLVPSDFLLDAMTYLSGRESSISKTFQLADPHPLSVSGVVQTLAQDCEKKLVEIPLPKSMAKFAIGTIPGLENWLGIPRSSLDYFVHPTRYDTRETLEALAGTGIQCPSFETYSKTLCDFMKKNPNTRSKALT